jgi:ketosteroid isomerase-like protein
MDADLDAMITRTAAASAAFLSGDPAEITALLSAGDDVTIFGGFGGGAVGRDELVRRLTWASARFTSGELTYEPMTAGSSGDLGYAVGIERGRVTMAGDDAVADLVLRVTHVFRREAGQWRIVHRHADPITEVTPPTAIVAG